MGFIDWNSIREQTNILLNQAEKLVKQYTPESWSKEKQFVNAIVASLALMTVADKKIDVREIKGSVDMINSIDQINELNMQTEAVMLFERHVDKLTGVLNNEIKFTIEVAKLVGDIAKIKQYPEYAPMIFALLDYVAKSDGDISSEELAMKKNIESSLK